MFLRVADLVVEAVAMVVAELVCVGQVAVYSTAESCAFLQSANVVMVSEHVPVKVELMVMVSQLVAMLVLQLARSDPWEAALEADLTRTKISFIKIKSFSTIIITC